MLMITGRAAGSSRVLVTFCFRLQISIPGGSFCSELMTQTFDSQTAFNNVYFRRFKIVKIR